MKKIVFGMLYVVATLLFVSSGMGQSVRLEGQVVCCEECWAEADRTKVEYGTAEDLLKSQSCVANGDPTLIAVREGDKFTLYRLDQRKFRLPGKNWLEFIGKRVAVTGTVQKMARLEPDFTALLRSHNSINGVLVTAASGSDGYDFHSRYFWPWSGTNEDPVTGGSHTFLAKYWSSRLGKTKMRSFQASKRTGFMEVELNEDKLKIKGQAVIVFEGRLAFQV